MCSIEFVDRSALISDLALILDVARSSVATTSYDAQLLPSSSTVTTANLIRSSPC